jgi:hypothetical protein
MAVTERAYLLRCWETNICPFCRKLFPVEQRIGSGKREDGGFCGLGCFAEYYKLSLQERHNRILRESAGKADGTS